MALFWSKKPKAEKVRETGTKVKAAGVKSSGAKKTTTRATKAAAPAKAQTASVASTSFTNTSGVILRPHITEKSGLISQSGVYTFEVAANANKNTVAKAVNLLYKVKPTKVAIINLPTRTVIVKGRYGSVSGIRKAMVTLKKGDTIDFV